MHGQKYPSLKDFIKSNNLIPNRNLKKIKEGNLVRVDLKFQEFDEVSNLLTVSTSIDHDLDIHLSLIEEFIIIDRVDWYKEIYNVSLNLNK